MTKDQLSAEVGKIVADYVSPAGPGVSVLVGRGPEVLLSEGYGLADVQRGEPITPASRFVIGSVTKQFTCAAIMLLAQSGLLAYDDPVGKYLPEMPAAWRERVTLRHLMHHTSGVPEYLTEDFWQASIEGKYPDIRSFLELISTLDEVEFAPRERWRYCNSGYIMLGEVVSRASGEPFASFLRDRMFAPLGMNSTLVGESDERVARLATGYNYRSRDEFELAPWGFAVVGGADGNIISDTADLHRWSEALLTGRVLPPEVLEQALVPAKPLDPSFSRYGFGLMLAERRGVREISHGGGTLGYVTHLARYPDIGLTVVVLSNAAGIKLGELRGRIANLLLAEWMAPHEPVQLPENALAGYAGNYRGQPRDLQMAVTVSLDTTSSALNAVVHHGTEEAPAESYSLTPLGGGLFLADVHTDTYIQFGSPLGTAPVTLQVRSGGSVINLQRDDAPGGRG